MVDAQAPGVAGLLRAFPAELGEEDWPDRVLHELAGLHLLSRAHDRLDELPADLAATVRSRIGYPVAKADVLAGPAIADSWWALGAVDVVDATLRRRRVWLRGATSGRWAVWLTFAPPGQSFDDSVLPGTAISGDLHFYPGAGQHRALVGQLGEGPRPGWTWEVFLRPRRGGSSPIWSPRIRGPAGCRWRCWDGRSAATTALVAAGRGRDRLPDARAGRPTVAAARAVGWRAADRVRRVDRIRAAPTQCAAR